MKKKIKLNENQLRGVIRESLRLLNEGPGAGYDVTIEGLNVNDIQLKGGRNKDGIFFKFNGNIKPGVVTWKAEGYYYYDAVTSDGIEYDGNIVREFDDEENTIQGGTVEGCVYMNDSNFFQKNSTMTIDGLKQDIMSELTDFKVKNMIGGGYSHTNLNETF